MERITDTEPNEATTQAVGDAALQQTVGKAELPRRKPALSTSAQDGDQEDAASPSAAGPEPHGAGQRETDKPKLANVYTDPSRHTVSLLLDDRTANAVIYAVRVFVADLEAHAREARLASGTFPTDSYGAVNRLCIAGRHERLAARLRELERNYLAAAGGGWAPE